MNYSVKATEVNKSFGAHSYTCSEKVGYSQGDSTYIFRSYQKSSTIRDHTLNIDNKSGIFIRLNLHVVLLLALVYVTSAHMMRCY